MGVFSGLKVLDGTRIGDSIAINGVCETVIDMSDRDFTVDISETTLRKTNMKDLKPGDFVNLERALTLSGRLGGHLVQGHVNDTAEITIIRRVDEMYLLTLKIPDELIRYMINEGSVTLDGISLTVSIVDRIKSEITIQVIPHTYENTTLKYRNYGDSLNIETDMIGRYVESLLSTDNKNVLTPNKLIQWGY